MNQPSKILARSFQTGCVTKMQQFFFSQFQSYSLLRKEKWEILDSRGENDVSLR